MDKSTKNALLIWAATIAGGAGGSWASTRMGATLGLRLGPWGAVAGALIGSSISIWLSRRHQRSLQGRPSFAADDAPNGLKDLHSVSLRPVLTASPVWGLDRVGVRLSF